MCVEYMACPNFIYIDTHAQNISLIWEPLVYNLWVRDLASEIVETLGHSALNLWDIDTDFAELLNAGSI